MRQQLDYHICPLPDNVLAIVRVSWYLDGRADEVDEIRLMEDGQNGYDAFAALVATALQQGANVSVRSTYSPADLGIIT